MDEIIGVVVFQNDVRKAFELLN